MSNANNTTTTTIGVNDASLDDIQCFLCPLTQEVMQEPVITPAGHTYERAELEKWIESAGTDPMTRAPLAAHELRTNRGLADAIAVWRGMDRQWRERLAALQERIRVANERVAAADDDGDDGDAPDGGKDKAKSSSAEQEERVAKDKVAEQEERVRRLQQSVRFLQSRPLYAQRKQLALAGAAARNRAIQDALRDFDDLPEPDLKVLIRAKIITLLMAGARDDGNTMRGLAEELINTRGDRCSHVGLSWLLVLLGHAHQALGKQALVTRVMRREYETSVEKFTLAVALNCGNIAALRRWGWSLDRLAQLANDDGRKVELLIEAIELYNKALKRDANNVAVLDCLGRAQRALDRTDAALRTFERVVELDPTYARAYCSIGELHKNNSDWLEAEDAFRNAIAADSQDSINHYKLGKCFADRAKTLKGELRTSYLRDALDCFSRSLQLDATSAVVHANVVHVNILLGRLDDARVALERGLEVAPDDTLLERNRKLLIGAEQRRERRSPPRARLSGQDLAAHYHELGRCRPCRDLVRGRRCSRPRDCTFCHDKNCVGSGRF